MPLPSELYHQQVAQNVLVYDTAQENILPCLDSLVQKLNNIPVNSTPQKVLYGVFLCGDVGRGKSMLMQLLFDCINIQQKRRVHFHPFMEEMHERMHSTEAKGTDIIMKIATDIAKSAKVLCFDEFYVTNIGDAVLLGRLLEAFFKCGVTLCATSNWKIEDLYQDGHNRSLFQPFIKIIKSNMDEIDLSSEHDWRRKNITNQASSLETLLGNTQKWQAGEIDLLDTIIPLEHYKDDILIVKFKNICDIFIGRQRYLLLSKQIKGIIITDIPYLDKEKSGAAMRFVILVDLLYEHQVPMLATTLNIEDDIENICEEGPVAFAFQRTLSRLIELGQL